MQKDNNSLTSGCSVEANARGLGPRDRQFKSDHLDFKNMKKKKDIRDLAAELVYQADWHGNKTPEGVIVDLTQQTEKDILWAFEQFEKELFGNRIAKMDPEKEEVVKRSVILDAVLFSLRDVKEKIKNKYHIEGNRS